MRCHYNGRWWSRLRIKYPEWSPGQNALPAYDLATARQLLALTGELPASKRGLLVVLTEYRRALATLVSAAGPSAD